MASPSEKKPVSRLFAYGYGLGEFGFTFFNMLVAYYLMYYLDSVLKLPMLTAAAIYSGVQWIEVLTMLAGGILIDSLRLKGGKYRPWLIIGSILCAVSTIVMFTDFYAGNSAAMGIFVVAYFLCYCGYNTMWVAYRAMLNPLSHSAKDGVVLTMASSQMSSLAGIIFSGIGASILYGFSTIDTGYMVSAMLYGCVMVVCMAVVVYLVKPYDSTELDADRPRISLRDLFRGINRYTIVFFLAVTFRESVQTIFPTLLVYYFTNTLGQPEWMSIYLTTVTFTTFVGYTLAGRLAERFGKRNMFLASSLVACVALLAVNLVNGALVPFLVLMAVYMFCGIFSGAMIPAFMNDLAVFNRANYHSGGPAFNAAIGGAAIRLSQVVGGFLASFGLVAIGYAGSGNMSAEIAAKIPWLMTVESAVVILISTAIFTCYRIDDKKLEKAYAENAEDLSVESGE